jgi:hypothetical protein
MLLADLLKDIKTRIMPQSRPDPYDPDDTDAPFALVGAPLKPRPPLGHSSIAVQPEP